MFYHKIGVIILILKLVENSSSKFLTDEKDWSNSNSTIILSYQYQSLQSDYFTHAVCEGDNNEDIRVCNLHMEFPRFSGIYRKCRTTLQTLGTDEKPILRGSNLAVIGNEIIFPWIIERNDRDVLAVRLINMKNCRERNMQLEIVKKSSYSIVPFSDSFDIFYEPFWSKEVGSNRYHKISFDRDVTKTGAMPVPFFSEIPENEIMHLRSYFQPLEQLFPVSTISSSKGYFFLPRNISQVQKLSPEGRWQQSVNLGFRTMLHDCAYGLDGILMYKYLNSSSRRLVQLDENLRTVLDYDYTPEKGRTIVAISSIGVDEVLTLTCDKIENELEAVPSTNCYLEKIHKNGVRTPPLPIPQIHIRDSTQIYLSTVEEHICVNAVTYDDRGYPEKLQTVCTERNSLL